MSHHKAVLVSKYLRKVYNPDVSKLARVTNMLPVYHFSKQYTGSKRTGTGSFTNLDVMAATPFYDDWAFEQCRKLDTIPFNTWCLEEFTTESGLYVFIPANIDTTIPNEEIVKKYFQFENRR